MSRRKPATRAAAPAQVVEVPIDFDYVADDIKDVLTAWPDLGASGLRQWHWDDAAFEVDREVTRSSMFIREVAAASAFLSVNATRRAAINRGLSLAELRRLAEKSAQSWVSEAAVLVAALRMGIDAKRTRDRSTAHLALSLGRINLSDPESSGLQRVRVSHASLAPTAPAGCQDALAIGGAA